MNEIIARLRDVPESFQDELATVIALLLVQCDQMDAAEDDLDTIRAEG